MTDISGLREARVTYSSLIFAKDKRSKTPPTADSQDVEGEIVK